MNDGPYRICELLHTFLPRTASKKDKQARLFDEIETK